MDQIYEDYEYDCILLLLSVLYYSRIYQVIMSTRSHMVEAWVCLLSASSLSTSKKPTAILRSFDVAPTVWIMDMTLIISNDNPKFGFFRVISAVGVWDVAKESSTRRKEEERRNGQRLSAHHEACRHWHRHGG